MSDFKKDIWNKRMLLLMQHALETGAVSTEREFAQAVGLNIGNVPKVKNGVYGFTIRQMVAACKRFGVSMDWLCGLSAEMKAKTAKSPLAQLKDAVRAIEAAMLR